MISSDCSTRILSDLSTGIPQFSENLLSRAEQMYSDSMKQNHTNQTTIKSEKKRDKTMMDDYTDDRRLNYDDTDDEFAGDVAAKLTPLRVKHTAAVAVAKAAHAVLRRATLTILLEERDAFPLRTRIRIDDVAEDCLQQYDAFIFDDAPDDADAVADPDLDPDDVSAIDAVADAGGDVADDVNHNNRNGIRIRLVSLLDGYETPSRLIEFCLTRVEEEV